MAERLPLQASAVEFTLEIPTGRSELLNHTGTFVRVRSANRSFSITLGHAAPFGLTPGSQFTCPPGTSFPFLKLINTSPDTLVITLIVGQGDISADSTPQVERAANFVANAATSLAAGATLDLDGLPTSTLVQRREFLISNLDPSLQLRVRDQAGNEGLTVFAQTSIALPVAGFLQVYNPNGAPVALNVSEIWYINA